MSKAVVIDIRAIGRAFVQMSGRQMNKVKQLFEATEPFLFDAWARPEAWAPVQADISAFSYPALTNLEPVRTHEPVQAPVTRPEEIAEPDTFVDELLAFLSKNGLGSKVQELPSGAVRIDVEELQYVRVR